jgi:hypothetical protein
VYENSIYFVILLTLTRRSLRLFERLRVRSSKTRTNPWFVRFQKARCDVGSPASRCGSLIPASGAMRFSLLRNHRTPVAALKPAATPLFPAPGHRGGVISEPRRQSACSSATTCRAAASWLAVASFFDSRFPELPGRRRPRNAVPFALAALNAPGRPSVARGHWQAPFCTDACQWRFHR